MSLTALAADIPADAGKIAGVVVAVEAPAALDDCNVVYETPSPKAGGAVRPPA